MVRSSVQNIHRLFEQHTPSNSVMRKQNSISPFKRSYRFEEQPQNPFLYVKSLIVLQQAFRKYLNRKLLLKKLKVMSHFRPKLLAIYKGWVVRFKIFKSFTFRSHIRDIKMLRTKSSQLTYLNTTKSSTAVIA